MEYDDSDFGSQNPPLNSEELSKPLPVLSTYSLPKYDFDDSLQGDIRFDSLVETETFLGIESQEDTSWIDDFSRGSSRIEFSSRNAETPSILGRNNVWSEATSLESVEMLLNSVGQEDIIHGETEVQHGDAVQELRTLSTQLKQNEEERDHLSVKDVSSGVAFPIDGPIQKFLDDNAVKLHPTKDVLYVTGELCGFGSNVDYLLQETDSETKDVKAPVLQAESQVNCPQTNIEFADDLSSGLHHGNDTGNLLNQKLQVNGSQEFSVSLLEVSVEGVADMVLEKECKSDVHAAESTTGDLENDASLELETVSGGEPGPIGTGNNHLKEPFDSSTEEHHGLHSMEVCLSQVDTSNATENCKCEGDEHIHDNACEGSNVNLEGGTVLTGHSFEATDLNCGACCNEKVCSDALVTGSDGVQDTNEIHASSELNENTEEASASDDGICCAGANEDELCGRYERRKNAVALKDIMKSSTENDELLETPRSEMGRKPADYVSSLSIECSSAVLASSSYANEDLSIHVTPSVTEEHIAKEISILTSAKFVRDTAGTTANSYMSDGNDKCIDISNVQSNSEVTIMDDKSCNVSGIFINDIRVADPCESVCRTENEGNPCESASAIPAANVKDYKEPENSPQAVSCGSGSIDDTGTENFIQCQFDTNGSSCTDDGSVIRDPKASDASDNDKGFSFIITSSAQHSESETVKLWRPFMSESPVSCQNLDDSLLTPGMEPNLGNQGSHQATDEQTVTESISASKRKPRRALGKTNKESAKRDSRQKPKNPSKIAEPNMFRTVESGLPDLNHASFLPAVHLQQFTDLQQLQLRAQIFVYGSLIQGTPPDEACMVAAFGGPDGGRSIWENARRQCVERMQDQRCQNSNPETSLQHHSCARTADQKCKTSKSKNKNNIRNASKNTPTHTTLSHLTPPASPLWTVHTPPDPMHFGGMPSGAFLEPNIHPRSYPRSSLPMASTAVYASSWSPHPVPWVASPQTSAPKGRSPLMLRSKMEPVILTPVRESYLAEISVRHTSPGSEAHPSGHSNTINTIPGVPSPLTDDKSKFSPGQAPDSKPRKRKNIVLSEASMVTEAHHKFELGSVASVRNILPTAVATPNSVSKVKTDASSLSTLVPSSADCSAKSNRKGDDKIMLSDDICNKMDEAKLHAEGAAAYSVAAVDIGSEMWSQLAKKKDSAVAPAVEAKIASAALAVAAAVSVAKAAAAAAKVASDAAIRAKLMAAEAMYSCRISLVDPSTEIALNSSVPSGNALSSSLLMGENEMNCGSSLTANVSAREKIESASAASRQALYPIAVLNAAELAAEAVTQAGKVAVMGNPLPLCELANAGLEGCWKLTFDREMRSNTVIDCHMVDTPKGGANKSVTDRKTIDIPKETRNDLSLGVIPDDRCKHTSVHLGNKAKKPTGTAEVKPIKEGSYVEIYKQGNAIKAAWFSAKILELKDGEAYVCYTEKPPIEGSEELKEWIRLDNNENDAPNIRASHPLSAIPTEGTRKRHREAVGRCSWSVGDRVDAWRQNCWWEGIITEKSSTDDTAFTVHFSAQGETSTIKAFHLRPSLFWQDGEWVECSSSMSIDGGIRQEKRMKLCDPEHKIEMSDTASEKVDPIELKIHRESRLLGLSDKEKTFNVGKGNKDGKGPAANRMARPGLQNVGKQVSFGVPRAGKKRKFMDVSQHYVSHDSKINENNDLARCTNMQLPKASVLPGWKSGTRIDLRDKQVPTKKLTVANSRKATSVLDRNFDKNRASSTVSSKDSVFISQGMPGFASFSNTRRARNAPFEFSSSSNEKSSMKLLTSAGLKSELSSKTKFEPSSQTFGKIEEDKVYDSTVGTSNSEGVEPRRSNRRIQPTSRLLEGLQTSMSIPKLPSIPHDKGNL